MRRRSAAILISIVCSISGRASGETAPALSLAESVRFALERSPEVAQARIEVQTRELEEPLFLSELDTQIEAGYEQIDDQLPRAVPAFEGDRSDSRRFDFALAQKTLLGTQARLEWVNQKLRNNAPFRVIDPTVDSTVLLEVSQPLLRYFWGRPDVARRRRFRANVRAAQARLSDVRNATAARTAQAYLEYYFAGRRAEIAREALEASNLLLRRHREKKRYGLVEDSDLLQAQVSVDVDRMELELALSDRQTAHHRLLQALRVPAGESPTAHAVSLPPPLETSHAAEAAAVAAGLEHRGDVRAARASLEAAEAALRVERLDTLPDLTLTGSYGAGGLSDSYSQAWDDLETFDRRYSALGVNLTIPLTFRKERLLRRSRLLAVESARHEATRITETAVREIRDAWVNLALQRERLEKRRQLLELQRRKRRAEEVRFNQGRSSTDTLVRFQQDVVRAEQDLARAEVNERLARIELARATGTLDALIGVEAVP